MEAQVKSRLVHYYVEVENPLDPSNKILVERLATAGQTLHSGEGTDTESDRYGLRDVDFRRLSNGGHLFTDEDQQAPMSAAAFGETRPTNQAGDPAAAVAGTVPLTFADMAPWQIEEWLRSAKPSNDEIIEAIEQQETPEAKELLANRFLTAHGAVATASGDEQDEELVQKVLATLGSAQMRGPEGAEGVEGTEPESTEDRTESGGNGANTTGTASEDGEGGDSSSQSSQAPQKEATESARQYAEAHDINLADVPSNGPRITLGDVKHYHEQQKGQGQ